MTSEFKGLDPIVSFFVKERLRKRKTQTQIATQTGIKLTTYQRIEQGKRSPDLTELRKLCRYHQLTFVDVVLEELNKRPIDDQELLSATQLVPNQIRHALIELIKSITQKE
ncbi:helix-turn-helix transcriptional regulator [Vibrio harveyi]|uniref:helix-turn-helix domain-containing protein n=1 Tax=Vibrio harveyi TaxID=669 RepID=UPI0031BBAA55